MTHTIILLIALTIVSGLAWAEDWITIYNDDLSLVRSNFELDLKAGRQEYNFDDITSRIEAPSVIVKSLNGNVRVAEQNYEYDLAGKYQIIAKYIDKDVELITKDDSRVRGILKFYDGSSFGILESSTKKLLVVADGETQIIQLAELPSNFYTKPTLHWSLISNKAGKQPIQLTYLTGGFSWDVTYNSVWDEKNLDLNSWVTIQNTSGRAFNDVNLKLIAGEVNQVQQRGYNDRYYGKLGLISRDSSAGSAAPSFQEKAFHDFHMYTLDQKASFANNQTKQLELYPPQNVKASGIYEYYAWADGVNSVIKFKNTEENGIGKPLPKGVIKVYKQDTDGNLEFIGEDSIDHTGRNEEVSINTGTAFDLFGSTMVRDQQQISKNVSERLIQVTLRNNSDALKKIDVIYQLGGNSRIVEVRDGHKYTVDTDNKATFEISVKQDAQVILTFKERTAY